MHFLAVSLRKDWARVRRDPSSLLTSVGIPVVLAVLMTLIFGREPATPHGLLLVDDEDHSIASDRLLGIFRSGPISQMLTIEMAGGGAGRASIDRGDASAFLIIPRGFQAAFLGIAPSELRLFTNPSERILPQIIEQSLAMATDAATYAPRGARYPQGPMDQTGRIGLESGVVHERPRQVNFAAQFLPSMLFMGLLFTANSMAADIWKERAAGTLRRLVSSPVSLSAYLGARLIFVAMVYVLVAAIGIMAAQRVAGMPVPDLPAATMWMAFTGIVFYLLFLVVAMQASTPRAASVLANLIVFPLAMLGGCFFPFDWMPRWMATIGRLTPNGWAITQFQAILKETASAGRLAAATAALATFALIAFLLALRRLRGGFAV